jgi:hypothetical protein
VREIFGAFGSEVFRPLMTILLPGMAAISTWAVGLLQRYEPVRAIAENKRLEGTVVVFLVALAVGEVLEDIGSRIEFQFDKHQERKNPQFKQEWYRYLALQFEKEPVGHRYLRNLVLRLKFELGLGAGIFIGGLGILFTTAPMPGKAFVLWACTMLPVYLLWEAHDTHEVLGELRTKMLELLPQTQRQASQPPLAKATTAGGE